MKYLLIYEDFTSYQVDQIDQDILVLANDQLVSVFDCVENKEYVGGAWEPINKMLWGVVLDADATLKTVLVAAHKDFYFGAVVGRFDKQTGFSDDGKSQLIISTLRSTPELAKEAYI